MMRFDGKRKNIFDVTPQRWPGVGGWRDASYQFPAEIMPASFITEIAGNDRSWPWIVNLNMSAISFSARAFKAVMPPRIRWAVADVCFGVVFLAAGAGDYASLDEPVISDKWVHAAEVFALSTILLKVPVAVGLQAPNPAVKAAAEAVDKVEFLHEGGYTLCCLATADETGNEAVNNA